MAEDPPTVVKFPTRRRAAYRNPPAWWNDPLPPNVTPIRRPRRPAPPEPLPPLAFLVLALIEAVRTEPASWARSGGPDVLHQLSAMAERFKADPEVLQQVQAAMRIALARRSGRI